MLILHHPLTINSKVVGEDIKHLKPSCSKTTLFIRKFERDPLAPNTTISTSHPVKSRSFFNEKGDYHELIVPERTCTTFNLCKKKNLSTRFSHF